jgi:hypothetical protein
MSMTHEKRIRAAALVVLAGLVTQLVAVAHWTPLTFVLFAMLGAPLVLVGVGLYARTVWLILKERRAL